MFYAPAVPLVASNISLWFLGQVEEEKKAKEHQITQLNEDLAAQDEAIAKLSKEKSHLQEENAVSKICKRSTGIKNIILCVNKRNIMYG